MVGTPSKTATRWPATIRSACRLELLLQLLAGADVDV
jgi:hypothetical protein